jgi:phosphoglycolate phosphatase-like HAD superfamily hydrolase
VNVFALDFDGVLCDSATEMAVSAWRAGSQIWPDWHGQEPPDTSLERFRKLRPLLETGYQAILLMGLIQRETSDEVISDHFPIMSERLLEEIGYSRARSMRLFGQTRDRWIARNLEDWLSRHRFYTHAIEAFVKKIDVAPVFILTTKPERFAKKLLEARNIDFPSERIFGLDRGKLKEETLEQLVRRPEFRGARFHFVEDRLATLQRAMGRKRLNQIQLYLVDWGYNTAEDRKIARQTSRITLWSPEAFLAVK